MTSNEQLTSGQSLAANGKSFHWARRFLGARMGGDAAHLYAFCRLLDDMADGDIDNGPARLADIRADMLAGRSGNDPAVHVFLPLMTERRFPPDVLIALVDGLLEDREDVVVLADEAALLRYAYRVAGTVGLLMCRVPDCHAPSTHAHAIDLGIAMQLTNIARDVPEDARMNRRRLPGNRVGDADPGTILAAADDPDGPVAREAREAVARLLLLADRFYASRAEDTDIFPGGRICPLPLPQESTGKSGCGSPPLILHGMKVGRPQASAQNFVALLWAGRSGGSFRADPRPA